MYFASCMKELKVIELFAGVGGFRLGLEGWKGKSASSGYKKKLNSNFKVVWSNQWEPSTKAQHASDVYVSRWGAEHHSNADISVVPKEDIPDHDVLVGGFPCQDYSVANSLKRSGGLEGKKGVLWWEIMRIIKEKGKKAPKYLILENVDRLLKSPAKQRGRDFAIMLSSLASEGYAVEWRVINAADYGMPQRRKRTFIVAYKSGTKAYKNLKVSEDFMISKGILSNAFPCSKSKKNLSLEFTVSEDLLDVSENFNTGKQNVFFENGGVMKDFKVYTARVASEHDGNRTVLGDIVLPLSEVPNEFHISQENLPKWKYAKGAKKEERKRPDGGIYFFSEGSMSFPDSLENPARTIITSEGGSPPSRFKHIIYQDKQYRRLTPIELERCNMFPDKHTEGATDTKRAFFMGNALVVGVIEKIGISLQENIL
jgi:DNA (cytosine-5)-methyltransferase 1